MDVSSVTTTATTGTAAKAASSVAAKLNADTFLQLFMAHLLKCMSSYMPISLSAHSEPMHQKRLNLNLGTVWLSKQLQTVLAAVLLEHAIQHTLCL